MVMGRGASLESLAREGARQAALGREMAEATAAVVARRLEIARAALDDPRRADVVEMGLMGSEKVEAFALAGGRLAAGGAEMLAEAGRTAEAEARLAGTALNRVLAARDLPTMAAAQSDYAMGLWGRAWTGALEASAMMMKAQGEALAPLHAATTANARRLKVGR